ncbi:hypothetical protein VP01_5615g1, partial [Puccinia sorghi]
LFSRWTKLFCETQMIVPDPAEYGAQASLFSSFLIILHTPSSDESAICSHDLLQTFARSRHGTSAACYQHNANTPRFTLVPGCSYNWVLSILVAEHKFKARDFKHFLKWKLVSPPYIWTCEVSPLPYSGLGQRIQPSSTLISGRLGGFTQQN